MLLKYLLTGLLLSSMLISVLILSTFGGNAAQNTPKNALIIVSDFESDIGNAAGKAVALYRYLDDDGWNIVFLAPEGTKHSQKEATVTNVEDAFNDLIADPDDDKEVLIYVFDHIIDGGADSADFRYSDGCISTSIKDSWMDEMSYSRLDFIICGNQSGMAGPYLSGVNRCIMSSMDEYEINSPDAYNITRSLKNPDCDFDLDGVVSFEEAHQGETELLAGIQNPQKWI